MSRLYNHGDGIRFRRGTQSFQHVWSAFDGRRRARVWTLAGGFLGGEKASSASAQLPVAALLPVPSSVLMLRLFS